MTTNDSTASSTEKKAVAEQETNIYKTLFMVTAPVTALLAGACVWDGRPALVHLPGEPGNAGNPGGLRADAVG